jgi:hypothetical protein
MGPRERERFSQLIKQIVGNRMSRAGLFLGVSEAEVKGWAAGTAVPRDANKFLKLLGAAPEILYLTEEDWQKHLEILTQKAWYDQSAMDTNISTAYAIIARHLGMRVEDLKKRLNAEAAPTWPEEKWKGSSEELSRKPHSLVAFLRRVWVPFIDAGMVPIVTRAMVSEHDPEAGAAIRDYVRANPLPPDIRIVRTRDIKTMASQFDAPPEPANGT